MVFVLGFLALSQLNRDLAPPLNFNRVLVEIQFPESTAADLEKEVVFPIEEKLKNFPGIKQISSTSSKGKAQIWISFPADYKNTTTAAAEIKQNIDSLKPFLPQGIRSIDVFENKIQSNFQNEIIIRNFDIHNKAHWLWLESFKNKLSQIKGIIEVNDQSFPKRSVKIDLKESAIKQYEIDANEINQKILDHLQFRPLGAIRKGNNFTFIEFEQDTEKDFITGLRNMIIFSSPLGYKTTLSDIAKVDFYFPEYDRESYENGKNIYYLNVRKDLNSDIIKLHDKVLGVVKEKNNNNLGLTAASVVSGKSFIDRQLKALKSNGFIGALIVFFLLVTFLSFKSSVLTIIGIPFSYCATFLTMLLLGYGIDILSIVGLILVSGMLVDDALIVSEKYNEGLEQGFKPFDAAKVAISELFIPVCGTILTTVVAFLPLLLIPSDLGNILKSIPVVLITALFFSLVESFIILPNHLSHFVKKPVNHKKAHIYFEKFRTKFESLTLFLLNWKYSLTFLFLMITAGLFFYSKDVEKNFSLNISDEIVKVEGELVSSHSKKETFTQIAKLYDQIKAKAPESDFETVELSIGSLWRNGEYVVSDRVFRVLARVKEDHDQPNQAKDKFLADIKPIIKKHAQNKKTFTFIDANKAWWNEEDDKAKYLTFNFYTKNTSDSLDLKNILQNIPKKINGLGPLDLGADNYVDRWSFKPDLAKMALYSVSKQDIQTSILGKVDENWIKEVRLQGRSYPVNLTIDNSVISKTNFDPSKVLVLSRNHIKLPLTALGEWSLNKAPKTISHLNGYRVQKARFKVVDEKNREAIVKQANTYVKSIEDQFPEYIIKASGESLQEAENKSWVVKALLACVLGIFFVLALTLNSLTQPLIVSLPIPFSVAGVMLIHKLHNLPIGVLSMVGLIGAIGVSVNGTLIMSDQINLRFLRFKNATTLPATLYSQARLFVLQGSSSRLRALCLTTATTLGGLFPMAYGVGGDTGFTRPLAFAMAWGIVFASFMSLFFFPSIYLSLYALNQKFMSLKNKFFNSTESDLPKKKEAVNPPQLSLNSNDAEILEEHHQIPHNSI